MQVRVPDRPADVRADPVEADLHRIIERRSLIRSDDDRLEQFEARNLLDERSLLANRALCRFPLGETARHRSRSSLHYCCAARGYSI